MDRIVVLALTPITNPTSTILFEAVVAAKKRNAIIFRPSDAPPVRPRRPRRPGRDASRPALAPVRRPASPAG
jgi:hypothetical protein